MPALPTPQPPPDRTVGDLAALVGGAVVGDATRRIARIDCLPAAGPNAIVLVFGDSVPTDDVRRTRAGAIVVGSALDVEIPQIVAANAPAAFTTIARALHPRPRVVEHSIDETATIDPSAELTEPVHVGPRAVVEPGAEIGPGTVLGAGVIVGTGARVGEGCVLHAGAVLYPRVVLGDFDEVGPGAVLGADGFGYVPAGTHLQKVAQLGDVRLGPDVVVGPLATVDRAALGSTRIERGVRMGAITHVAHNCTVGEDTVLFPFSAMAGSASLGARVELGLHALVYDHRKVADDVRFEMNSVVLSNISEAGDYAGHPLLPSARWRKVYAALSDLARIERTARRT